MIKLCKDCQFCVPQHKREYLGTSFFGGAKYKESLDYSGAKCGRTDLITGNTGDSGEYCSIERRESLHGGEVRCGPDAKFFTPK